jgi:hypothetical protein
MIVRLLKALGVGILTGILALVLWIVGDTGIQIAWQMWQQRGQGGGGLSFAESFVEPVPVLLIGFAIGFVWMMRPRKSHAIRQ